ncbi:hypothetical protein F4814DRAFT_450803 [Daldinia grandis]|nr:hypothetical protein F4814DRAFT_450803 [Daldinia grandis]
MGSILPHAYPSYEWNNYTNGPVASATQPIGLRSNQQPSQQSKVDGVKMEAGAQNPRGRTHGKGRKGRKGKERKENERGSSL